MLHLRHWKIEISPHAKERREQGDFCPKASEKAAPPRIFSASREDQCLTGEIYLYQDFLHDDFSDSWRPAPSDTKAA